MYFKSEMLNFQQQCMDSSKDCHALKHLAVKMTIQSSSADIAFGLDDEQIKELFIQTVRLRT